MKYLITAIGTHCSWKSSYARELLDYANWHEEVKTEEWYKMTLGKDVFALWHYHAQCWGCDGFWPISKTKLGIIDLCQRDEKVMVCEWVLFVTDPVFSVLRQASQLSGRKVVVCYLYVSEKEALKRLNIRNGWKARWDSILTKKRYYDKRIKDLEQLYPDFKFMFINTEEISPKEAVAHIKKEILI